MKTLLLLRHGKSDWGADFADDHERPLAKRGRKAAERMGRFLTEQEEIPDRILTSSAVRARDTAARAATAGGWSSPIDETPDLYEATPEAVLGRIQTTPDDSVRLLVAGHEPTCSMLTGALIGGAAIRFPTAALARIDFPVTRWRQVAFGNGTLIWLLTPKLLSDSGPA